MPDKEVGQAKDDPGRAKQIAANQHPTGQTGVQTGKVGGVQVSQPQPTY